MIIREITQDQFENFNIIKETIAGIFANEIKWFVNNEKNLLGVLLCDNIDNDWSHVILGLESDGTYRAIDVNVSYNSIEEAESALKKSIISISEKGFKEESLFNLSGDIIRVYS